MVLRPSVLCPVDFSDASRGALRYAAAIAEHFYAALTVVTVDDPLLAEAAQAQFGESWMAAYTRQSLEQFVNDVFRAHEPQIAELNFDIGLGKPAAEILRLAHARHVDLIVMSTHGATGARKLLFGSTTERVLRETDMPLLITPAYDTGPQNLEDMKSIIRRVVVPVDFTPATKRQARIARGLAEALDASVVLAHVIEPPPIRIGHEGLIAHVEVGRRTAANEALEDLRRALPPVVRPEIVLAAGDPAEEIARIARKGGGDIIVMGLHSAAGSAPRMGSVTYRILCHTDVPVLALPPMVGDSPEEIHATEAQVVVG